VDDENVAWGVDEAEGDGAVMRGSVGTSRDGEKLVLECPARRSSAPTMRRALRAYLRQRSVDERAVRDVMLAAAEALNNAILHAGAANAPILVSALVHDGRASIEIRDAGSGFEARGVDASRCPGGDSSRGRGLFLIHSVMDELRVESDSGGTTVRMVRLVG
jgi:anti-sigma regulatory factor (Ser/Thr protein kinase)